MKDGGPATVNPVSDHPKENRLTGLARRQALITGIGPIKWMWGCGPTSTAIISAV